MEQTIKWKPDLVVVSAQADDEAAPNASFGSVSHHLFRKCPSPVWAVQRSSPPTPRRVLVAVDPRLEGTDSHELSVAVLDFAKRVLVPFGDIELHIVHVWHIVGERFLEARMGLDAATRLAHEEEHAATRAMDDLIAKADLHAHPKVQVVKHVVKGNAASVIPSLASRVSSDLVILGSAARTGLTGFFIGSVAEAVLHQLRCSTVVVKPPKFVSPVAFKQML